MDKNRKSSKIDVTLNIIRDITIK